MAWKRARFRPLSSALVLERTNLAISMRMWFWMENDHLRPAPLALGSIALTFALSSSAMPFRISRTALRPIADETIAPDRMANTHREATQGAASLRFGRSIGSPTEGQLVGGAHLDETSYLRIVPAYGSGDARWGLEPLVDMIDRAARAVRRQFPDSILYVGQLSRAGGGDIDRHRSHESGRDADIAFFLRSAAGKELAPSHFLAVGTDGATAAWPGAYFDEPKNWALVAAMVSDIEAHVTHLFVAAPLRARLLAYAERAGAPAIVRMRAAEVMQQPRGAQPHDDHFHVRIACPAHMTSCVENPPPHPSRPARAIALPASDGQRPGISSRRGGPGAQPLPLQATER